MRVYILAASLLLMIYPVTANINIEFSNLNVSDYQVETYAPNKTLLYSVGFDENFSLDATDDYIIHIKPKQSEVLNESNIAPFIRDRLGRFKTMAWLFGYLFFIFVTVYFLVNLIPKKER